MKARSLLYTRFQYVACARCCPFQLMRPVARMDRIRCISLLQDVYNVLVKHRQLVHVSRGHFGSDALLASTQDLLRMLKVWSIAPTSVAPTRLLCSGVQLSSFLCKCRSLRSATG